MAAVISALLLSLAFPPAALSLLAFAALVPLIIACTHSSPPVAFLYGLVSGSVANMAIFYWVLHVPAFRWYHHLILGIYLGGYTALWCATLPIMRHRGIMGTAVSAAGWVVLDFIRGNLGFLALPWASLAHSQQDNPALIQIAAFTGEYGTTFVVVLINAALAQLFLTRKGGTMVVGVACLASLWLWGWITLDQPVAGDTIRVAAIQPSRPKRMPGMGSGNPATLAVLEKLTAQASGEGSAITIWPEATLAQWKRDPSVVARVRQITATIGSPIITGVSDMQKFVRADDQADAPKGHKFVRNLYNSAFYIGADGRIDGPYNKNILVPFAEYLPFSGIVPWPKWLVPSHNNLRKGSGVVSFSLPQGICGIPIICWENLFADYVRRSITQKPRILLHLVNDNWFGQTASALQHNAASVFRAVENGTPVVIASNTGPSQIIDARGRILARVPELFTTGIAVADIVPGNELTFYNRYGDAFVLVLVFILLAGLLPVFSAGNANLDLDQSIRKSDYHR